MSVIERARDELESLSLRNLDSKGLGRWDEEYYLVGLYHPLRSMQSVANNPRQLAGLPVEHEIGSSTQVELYVHVPFCNMSCTFCHFYKEIVPRVADNPFEREYIESVLMEVDNYSSIFGSKLTPRTIQFGGGTPSALSVNGLKRLLSGLASRFEMGKCVEVKFEFHPDMANDISDYRDKLRVLKEFGLTTVVLDLEASGNKVLKAIARGNTSREGYLSLIRVALQENIESIATAIMTGLPYDTIETFSETVGFLSGIENVQSINIYPLMYKPSDAVFQQRRRNPKIFPTPEDKDLMMVLANVILEGAGFTEGPSHFFTREKHRPRQQVAKARSQTLLGLGPASFGYLAGEDCGVQFMNYPSLRRYSRAVRAGSTGMWRASLLSPGQVALRRLMFGLNGSAQVSDEVVTEARHVFSDNRLDLVLESMVKLGLIEEDGGKISFTRRGRLRNSEVIFYLAEPQAVQWNARDPEFADLRRYEFFPNVSRDNQLLFERTLRD